MESLTVSPIFKSDNHSYPANYHQILLLFILSKLLEKHTYSRYPTCPLQRTPSNLYTAVVVYLWKVYHWSSTGCHDQWFRELEQGHDICTAFLDCSKPLDTVPHWLMLQKLQNYGFHHPQMASTLCLLTSSICLCKWFFL